MMIAYCVGSTVHLQERYADFAATDDTGYGYVGPTAKVGGSQQRLVVGVGLRGGWCHPHLRDAAPGH